MGLICNSCKKEKQTTEFHVARNTKRGYQYKCKDCKKKYQEENKEHRKKYKLKYYRDNKDLIIIKNKDYCKRNEEHIKKYRKDYYEKNKDIIRNYQRLNKDNIKRKQKAYREKNKDKINVWYKERRKKDEFYRLKSNIRSRIRHALNGVKSKKTFEIIGCSAEQLFLHLNYSNLNEPSHDHIIPLSWANTKEEIYALFRWENLQGMESSENKQKGNRQCLVSKANYVLKIHPAEKNKKSP